MPWTTANGISIHYHLTGEKGPVVILLHEMGGTLDSWDEVVPGLSGAYRVLCYDQRGAGLSEKVRQTYSNETAVADLEDLLSELKLPPPYHLVAVAAASTQAMLFLNRHEDQVKSLVLCNPALGVDPSRASQLEERAAQAEQNGMRAVLGVTLEKSYPPEITDRTTYEAYRGRYLANDPVGFGFANRMFAHTNVINLLPTIKVPTMVVSGKHDGVRPTAVVEDIAKKINGARFEVIEAGHFMPTTGPKPLTALLKDFFAKA